MKGTNAPTHLNPDGSLRVVRWCDNFGDVLMVGTGERPVQMAESDATAEPLVTDGRFGADVLRFPAGGSVPAHTHPGDHLLFVLRGEGTLTYGGREHELLAGLAYLVKGGVAHAIHATTTLVLLSVANEHRPAGSRERLSVCPE